MRTPRRRPDHSALRRCVTLAGRRCRRASSRTETAVARIAQTQDLTDFQRDILATVRTYVDREIIPAAQELEHTDTYPDKIVADMRAMGLFGLMIPEEYGGLGESLLTYALCVEELARGWMSVSGVINTHFIVAYMIRQHGTDTQKQHFLPRMATGEVRGAFSMSEPDLGSDVAAITTTARRAGDDYVINGQKMWLTNGGSSTLVAALVRTDEGADKPHHNLTTFLIEKPAGFGEVLPGLTIPGKIPKMGYKGIDTTELIFDDHHTRADTILGGTPGRGFAHMMDGVEVGRVNVSARACGVAQRAFELAVAYAQQRRTFGKPIAEHQAVAFSLAEMATKVEAGHLMMVNAARLKDTGERNDVAAGMAKYLCSEYCAEVTQASFRIHGGYGYSTEYEIERLMREAPFLLIGEGTSEIQKQIISRGLLREYRVR
ncbi:acyl-CoA dehydrogenase [Gordonia bronchialis]|nr:acyl-CoA dehydrogenase [Gordonia bronchialis]